MANKEQRGNREKRKPTKEKPKPAPQVASFSGAIEQERRWKEAGVAERSVELDRTSGH